MGALIIATLQRRKLRHRTLKNLDLGDTHIIWGIRSVKNKAVAILCRWVREGLSDEADT